ncbi:hypothetical protein BLNAU_8725 [Blattamonas nauphoetae]|uniref:Protein kinase domain-containing protein n=1 Tax=Blattamonas nauphoetae TaxID=2049346 RepID=A0ABQ9XXZ1_9EUKA|nr:hypothetical protein BLNAU_8725 [Blattamonas nauphoetae]
MLSPPISAAVALLLYPTFIQAITQFPQPLSTLLLCSDRNLPNDVQVTSILRIPAGIYHADDYMIESSRIKIIGDSSRIIHSSPKKSDSAIHEHSGVSGRNIKENSRSSLLVMLNSSVSINSICFDVRHPMTIVCWVSWSTVTLTSCKIMCGERCSPFVVGSHSGCDGSSISFVSCCQESSTQNQLFPLVDFDSLTNPSFVTSVNADNDFTTHSADGTVSVTCVNHLMSDADLLLGTGPLLNFRSILDQHRISSSLSVETSLSHSRLRNVTSSPSPALRQIGSIGQSQKMIGVEVSGCTNHLYGTACDDMNNGGSVLCLNSSFSRCSTSLAPSSIHPTYTLQHRTGQQRFQLPPTDSSSVQFSHCTFHTMTTTKFPGGAAIVLSDGISPVSIAACSFVNCKFSSSVGCGGAVCVEFNETSSQPVSVTSSVFSNCSAPIDGGALSLLLTETVSIADCCFVGTGDKVVSFGGCIAPTHVKEHTQISNCRFSDSISSHGGAAWLTESAIINFSFSSFISCGGSSISIPNVTSTVGILNCEFFDCTGGYGGPYATNGGGIWIQQCSALLTVKDCLFDNCTATNGGGLCIDQTASFKLDYLKFRGCTGSDGNDVHVALSRDEVVDGNMITNCVSTTTANNVYFSVGSPSTDSDIIANVTSIDVPAITLSSSLNGDAVGGSLSVTTNASVNGKMLVVLDNSESDYEKPNLDSPPAIARLFVFDLSSSTTASQSVLFNEWNLLQYESNYSISIASLVGTDITLSSSLIETPNPARIVEVITNWSSSQPEQMSFQLKGRTLLAGNYVVKVKDVEELSIIVSFTGNPTNPYKSRNMHSMKATISLAGILSKLTFNTKYKIESVQKEGEQSPLILDPPHLYFTTPDPTRLTSVSDAVFLDPLDKSTVTITLSGGNIPTGLYWLNFTLIGEQQSTEFTLSASFESSESGTASAVVFKRDGSQPELVFGKNYIIYSLSNDANTIWIPSLLSFSVPECPGIVSTVLSASLNDDKTVVTLTLSGTNIVPGPTHVVLSDGSNDVTSNGDLSVIDLTRCTVTFAAGWAQSSSQVAYHKNYSVKSITSLSDSFLVRSSATLTTPAAPCVTDISCNFDTNLTHFVVTFTGQDLPVSETYTAHLSPTGSFEVTFSDNVGMSEPIEGNVTNGMLFGREFILSSISQENNQILLNKTYFLTPRPPVVNTASFHSVNGIKTSCKLVLGGTDITLEGEFNVTLQPPLSIIMSFSSPTQGESDEMSLGWPGKLQFGQNYTIKSITRPLSDSPVCIVDSDVNFTTGSKPASILLFVNSSGSASLFCGEVNRPCSSVDVGLSIVSGIGFAQSEVKIVEKGTQNTVHSMSPGSVLSISASSTISATLEIGSSASMGSQTGLFVVSSARLEFHEISVSVLQTDASFVLVSGDRSTLVLKNTSFFGRPSDSPSNSESSEESHFVCSWSTGLLQLSNCTTTITNTQLHDLVQGAINMKSGMVDIETSTFHNNARRVSSFPSTRRNIHCSDGGEIEMGSLLGGDGSSDTRPHLWIADDECTLSGDDVQPSHPLFVPTLSTTSTSTLNKKEKGFDVTIIGSTLIPCGLSLELFEIKKDKTEGESKKIELTENSTISFTETNITFSLPLASLASLDSSLEWRGRLVFGKGQRTTDWFVIQKDSSSRMAQSVKDNMKWWVPLVVVLACLILALIVVVVLCLRRHSKKTEAKTQLTNEMNHQEMEVEKIEEDAIIRSDQLVVSSAKCMHGISQQVQVCEEQGFKPTIEPQNEIPVQDRVEAMSCHGEMKTVVVNKMDTLYERLHTKKMMLDRRHVEQMIVRGMMQMMENRHEETGLRLSSHWVLFDKHGEVCLKLGNEQTDVNEKHAATGTAPKTNEAIRWQAPEQKRREDGEEEKDVNSGLVSIFRLGLVLYEIETGLLPFGEMDEVNASRALHSGTLPKMDGVSHEMAELISSCLSLTPAARPSLSTIALSLTQMPESCAPGPNGKSLIS